MRAIGSSFRVAAVFALTACSASHSPGEATTTPVTQGGEDGELARFFPLEAGTVFSYETSSVPGGGQGLLIVQVSRPRAGRADLRMGSHTERLELQSGGIASVEGGYVLKTPLTSGSTWKGRSGTVRVVGTDEGVDVPAGHFEGCLRTVEESRGAGFTRTVTSVYCPHVGLVALDAQASSAGGEARETARLKSFGPRVDVASDSVTTTVDGDAGPLGVSTEPR